MGQNPMNIATMTYGTPTNAQWDNKQ